MDIKLEDVELPHKYFISYNFRGKSGTGFGNVSINRDKAIDSMEDIRSVEKYIVENFEEINQISIINYQRF